MNFASFTNLPNPVQEPSGSFKVLSPVHSDKIIATLAYRYSDIDLAMKGAYPKDFKILSTNDKMQIIQSAHSALGQNKEKLLEVAQLELGRSATDLELEWQATDRYLTALTRDSSFSQGECEARGITVVLSSYVWPIFYSVQFALMNFLAGNAVILKPSEKSTLTALKVIEILRQIPELKVLQAVVGEREVGRRLATHEAVGTILFQGSFEMGMRVKQDALSQPGKEVLLYLGSKNPALVFADAKDGVEDILIADAFLGAGQHCRSISVIFVEDSRLPAFSARFHELSKAFQIGGPQTGAFMGPLVDGAILDRYLKFIGISEREGAEVLMRGKQLIQSEKGYFVTPSLALFPSVTPEQLKKSVSLQTEILSPHVSLVGFKDESELMELTAQMNHGKLASVWTENPERASRIASHLAVGEVLINHSVFQFDPWLSTQARKRSGNHALLGKSLFHQLTFQKQKTR